MSKTRTVHVTFLIAALLLTACVAVLGGLSVARKVAAFQPLGFSAAPAGGGWAVTEAAEDAATGLLPGDQIFEVQGQSATSLDAVATALRSRPSSQVLVLRGGEVTQITYTRPPLDVDLPYLILALVGAAYLLIGFYTLVKDGRGAARLFFAWCLTSAAVFLLTWEPALDSAGRLLYVVDMLARLLLPPLTLHLFLFFPSYVSARGRGRRAVPFLYLPAAFLLLAQADLMLWGGRWLSGGFSEARLRLLDRLELGHLTLFAVAAIGVLTLRLLRSRDWEEQRQIRWVALGMAGGYLPFLALYAVPWAIGFRWPELATAGAVLPLALVPLTFAYAILRYKLWDIEVMVRDAVSYTLTLLVGMVGFSLANLAISRGLPEGPPLLRSVLVFMAGLGIAGILVPAKRGISAGLERLQYGDAFGKRRALAVFGRALLQERDLGRLCSKLLQTMEDTVDLVSSNLYLAHGDSLLPVRPEPHLPPRLPLDVLGAEFWDQEVRVLSGVGLPEPATLPAQRLFAAGYRYALPLTVHGTPVALALSSWKVDQERLTSDDVGLLRQLLDQAALAVENARLVDQLKNRLDEVSRLQQYSEGIIESSPAGIAVIGADGRIASANMGFAELVGERRDELPGRRLEEVLPVRPLPQPGQGPLEVAYSLLADRREQHLQVSTAHFDRSGGGDRILVVHDVTQRVAMEHALKERDRLASLGIMAAGVAHEVNTPLTGISSYAQMLLADTPVDDPRHDVLRKVERQTFRAAKIVNNLLDFARQRGGGEHAPVALAEVVDECLELLRERLSKRRIQVRWESPADGGPQTRGDAGELQQVMTNLLLNACDAMEEGGGTLTITLLAAGDRLRLSVADTGDGIPAENLEHIFEPFFTTKLGRGGTGLGLAISSDIVRHHGGQLHVASVAGEGSTFTLELPLQARGAQAPSGGEDHGGATGGEAIE